MEIDVEDESVIDTEPAAVLKALIDEAAGRTHWWLPFWQAEPCGDIPPDQVGGIFDVTVRKGVKVKFRARVIEISDKDWRVEYIGGAYRGHGNWSFELKRWKDTFTFSLASTANRLARLVITLRPLFSEKGHFPSRSNERWFCRTWQIFEYIKIVCSL